MASRQPRIESFPSSKPARPLGWRKAGLGRNASTRPQYPHRTGRRGLDSRAHVKDPRAIRYCRHPQPPAISNRSHHLTRVGVDPPPSSRAVDPNYPRRTIIA
ncbi:hypothetical protein B0I35DRAFT_77253 [Stachybotrys elegans]|uniref:Uncharacterized protein n=1 Tax=Stachybotrys elegans TaxID=80388 RepID=A0A8K0SK60_9HYPO|nr:hypothetical protein B0I35DRAFT_77253 [Stachybotrys elegans]